MEIKANLPHIVPWCTNGWQLKILGICHWCVFVQKTNNRRKHLWVRGKKGQICGWGFPKTWSGLFFQSLLSIPLTQLNPALKVTSLWDGTTSIQSPLLCKLLHLSAFDWLTRSAVAARWPGLTATCLDSVRGPCRPVFGSVPTLSRLALAWLMETLCPFHSRWRTPPPSGDHFAN